MVCLKQLHFKTIPQVKNVCTCEVAGRTSLACELHYCLPIACRRGVTGRVGVHREAPKATNGTSHNALHYVFFMLPSHYLSALRPVVRVYMLYILHHIYGKHLLHESSFMPRCNHDVI